MKQTLPMYLFILRENMTLDMINETLFFNINHLVDNVHVYHEGKKHQKLSSDDIWSTVYNKEYGLCYTLDIKKEKTLEIYNEPLVLALKYHSEELYPISTFCATRVKQMIHHERDLPTAMKFNELYHTMGSYGTYEYNIRKMNFDIETTWHTPCGQLFPEECLQIELQLWLEKSYNCKIPIFMTGNHLTLNDSLPNCPEEVVLEASRKVNEPNEKCPDTVPCSTSKYKIVFSDWTPPPFNSEKVTIYILRE